MSVVTVIDEPQRDRLAGFVGLLAERRAAAAAAQTELRNTVRYALVVGMPERRVAELSGLARGTIRKIGGKSS